MKKPPQPPLANETGGESPPAWFDLHEWGRLLRLVGPLIQIPLLWVFLKKPELARTRPEFLYGGMTLGLIFVLAGIALSAKACRTR